MTIQDKKTVECPAFVDMGLILNSYSDLDAAYTKLKTGGFNNMILLSAKEADGSLLKHPGHLIEKYPGLICSFSPMVNNKFENLELLYSGELGDNMVFYQHSPVESIYIHSAYQVMYKAFDYNALYISFPHNMKLAAGGVLNQGHISFKSGLPALTYLSEEAVVSRDLELARSVGNKLHFHQVSTKRSVELIRRAKAEGIKVTSGVSAGHLIYTDKNVDGFINAFKFLPPLREEEDRQALIDGVKDGTIDVISSGYFTTSIDDGPFINTDFTSLSPENIFSTLYENLIDKDILSLENIINLLSTNPRKILNLKESDETIVHEI